MNDEMMKCATCGTERVSRYAAYCHVCGSPLPELPPTPEDQAALNSQGQPPPNEEGYGYTSAPADAAPVPPPVHPQQQGYAATPPPGAAPEPAPPPPPGSPVRVYDRPDVPPSVVRRRKLTIVMAVIGVVISLLLLGLGPLRTALSARNEPVWSPPGTETPIGSIGLTGTVTRVAGLPPGMSAAQATARARQSTATVGPTWTPGVDLGTAAAGETAPIALPTLAPAATTTPRPTAAAAPSATVAPSATSAPATPAPAATAPVGATATSGVPATVAAGALPAALSGGRALAFVSDRSGSPQVWVMDAAGTSQLQVTRQGTNTSPVWSPDNRFLYYIGERNGEKAAYRLDITTGTEERVAADPSLVSIRPLPGGELAILRTENGLHSLYVGDRRLFQLDRSFQFQFSTDGRRVVIDPNSAPRVINVVDVATTQATEVAPANSWNAGWGRGDRLTYVSDRTGVASVYVAGPNGEEARAVSPGDKWSQAPAFSSDGAAIAFIGGDGPAWNVYIVQATGGNARRIGGPANPGKSPAWQPAGRLIAYESDRAGNWDIYATDPDGNERPLTNDPGNDVDPAWTW